jgi:transcription elongation factor GreA
MSDRIPMTSEGVKKLRTELEELKSIKRPKIIEAIAEARAHGDLKENAEYHAAREQQSFTEGRITEIESVLSLSQEIDTSSLNVGDKVVFGAYIKLLNLADNTEANYRIVGQYETDLGENYISVTSPIARALIGKNKGDSTIVNAPGGDLEYLIQDVSY